MNYKAICLTLIGLLSINMIVWAQSDEDTLSTTAEPNIIVQALVDDGVIDTVGLELYQGETLTLEESGVEFILGADEQDVVYGGEISLNHNGDEVSQCYLTGLAEFSEYGGGLTNGIITALFTDGVDIGLGLLDASVGNRTAEEISVNLDDNVQMVVVILDERLTVYIDDVIIIEDYVVSTGDGGFGIGFESDSESSSCVVENMFANLLESDNDGVAGYEFEYVPVIEMPSNLANYNSSAQNILSELQENNVIPVDGEFQTLEGEYIQTVLPVDYVVLDDDYDDAFVWGGTLTFNVDNTELVQLCELVIDPELITVNRNGTDLTYDDNGFKITFYQNGNVVLPTSNVLLGEYTRYQATRFAIVSLDDRVSVYLNGELVIEHFKIDDRGEGLGFGTRFLMNGANCEISNTWVYDISDTDFVYIADAPCTVSTGGTVNQRSEPSTSASVAGQLQAGTNALVIGQVTDAGGFIWWQLEDESWVREDVVNSTGGCTSVPTVE